MQIFHDPRRSFFDRLAATWHDSLEENASPGDEIVQALEPRPGQTILDLGCGAGSLSRLLDRATRGQAKILAVDLSLSMLKQAKRRSNGSRILFCQADAHALPFRRGSFDSIAMLAVFAHLRDKKTALREACSLLRRGGRLVIAHPLSSRAVADVHRAAGGPIAHDILPPAPTLRSWFQECRLDLTHYVDTEGLYLAVGLRRADA